MDEDEKREISDRMASLKQQITQIKREVLRPNLNKYRFIETYMQGDTIEILFNTRRDVLNEAWDVVGINNHLNKLDDEESIPSTTEQSITALDATEPVWYAYSDNSFVYPINEEPVTLAGAMDALEKLLTED